MLMHPGRQHSPRDGSEGGIGPPPRTSASNRAACEYPISTRADIVYAVRKRVVILGSTGSIGRAALEVVERIPERVELVGLAARGNWRLLAEQAARHAVPNLAVADAACFDELRRACPAGTRVVADVEGLAELVAVSQPDFVLAAIVGAAGLPATLAAVERGIDVGLANKESLVLAGSILMPLAARSGAALLPVDSEHSAIFQALRCGRREELRRVYLTASGGPFRSWPAERIERASLEDALKHPTWAMGPKITIDSATMMNKALEIIEARHLFGLDPDAISVLIHPQSIVHSMVEFHDGSLIAQLGTPDMRTPIQYALTHPERVHANGAALSWSELRSLEFEPPDPQRFPALQLGYEAARLDGSAGAVLNAANEEAVEQFRAGRIRFPEITRVTKRVFRRHRVRTDATLAQLLECDAWARDEVRACQR
jgi:1-deoxy-D-xylulose-5-phosphate reductoisomerase